MPKTETINMCVDSQLKSDAESIFASLGITLTEAIEMFLRKTVLEGRLPFDVLQPRYGAQTEAAMEEARAIMSGEIHAESYDSVAAMFAALDGNQPVPTPR